MTESVLKVGVNTALTRLLDQRYGDGLIYLTHAQEQPLFKQAKALGLVSEEGYLTRPGRCFWAMHINTL